MNRFAIEGSMEASGEAQEDSSVEFMSLLRF
jgi:hypothetical protein